MASSTPARDFGLTFGLIPPGPFNAITDVRGVRVGHFTLANGNINTGFTAILPHGGNNFTHKTPAAVQVINGFGKTIGTVQIEELGVIETPILLTNTLSVGTGFNALCKLAIVANPEIGRNTSTVNPVVAECNDGYLNDIQAMALSETDASVAIHVAEGGQVEQGSIGAGTGMSCFGFKGGIGTSSRYLDINGHGFSLGVLVLANFGRAGDLVLPDGRRPSPPSPSQQGLSEKGSIIIVIATDVPLETRQLRRVALRGAAGVARLGSFWGNGSGDICISFSTARQILHDATQDLVSVPYLSEGHIDLLFEATADATQEAVLNALCSAPAMTGRNGHTRTSLADWLKSH